ncbi:MAG: nitronate monooxygenase [Dehalococcoidia bacterium]|nr:nitronate monooxygenase [Dehalococcoidia bacterium]
MEWNNRVTQILGSKYPIMQGAYQGIGTSAIAAPVSEAGGFGIITAHALPKPERLREDIRKAKAMTDKPFGVNFSIGFIPQIDEMLEVAIEEGITVVETSVYRAGEYGKRLKEAGVKWIHKVACMDHALAAERQGADAVIIVGLEGIGFKHMSQLPTLISIAWAARRMKIPVIAAGGIGDARSFAAALAMGAEGVCMGTAFLATKECPISEEYKQSLVDASPTDPNFRNLALNPPNPQDYEAVMKERESLPTDKWLKRLEKVMLGQSADGPMKTKSMAGGSLAVAFIDKVVTVKELIDDIVKGAEEILGKELPRQFS